MPKIQGLSDIVEAFDLFLLDQFGVLHDGRNPYPGAIAALEHLKAEKKTIAILSNSGKRAAPNERRLAKLGFGRDLYDRFVSSGEVAWHILRQEAAAGSGLAAKRCFLIARDQDRSAVDGLDITLVDNPGEADLILITGSEADSHDEHDYRRLLAPAAAKKTMCVCTNPDKIMLTAIGPRFGAGRIAEIYEVLGGNVRWIGKPFPEIYRHALALSPDVDPSRTLCVGDSIEHDIAGAAAAGLKSLLVTDGILAGKPEEKLYELEKQHGVASDFRMSTFKS